MTGPDNVVDQDRASDAEEITERPRLRELLFKATMCRKVFARVSLARVDEQNFDALRTKCLGKRLERWRRQRAIRSGEGAELNQDVAVTPKAADCC
jgi:hypothetical protein